MAQGPSPLLGYNTNVRHKGKLYHIQTEDSGVQHPHIISHLFADGGRIVASKKTSYAQHVGVEDLKTFVKKMMQDQHKGMLIALRDGAYDETEGLVDTQTGSIPSVGPSRPAPKPVAVQHATQPPVQAAAAPAPASGARASGAAPPPAALTPSSPVDYGAFDRAAAKITGGGGRYQPIQPPRAAANAPRSNPPESIFGGDVLSEKSLDEVILSYLASDLDDGDGA